MWILSREVHLWCLFPEDIVDPALVKLYKGLLSDDELEKVKEAGSGPTHTGRVLARTLVRTTLARCKKPIFLQLFLHPVASRATSSIVESFSCVWNMVLCLSHAPDTRLGFDWIAFEVAALIEGEVSLTHVNLRSESSLLIETLEDMAFPDSWFLFWITLTSSIEFLMCNVCLEHGPVPYPCSVNPPAVYIWVCSLIMGEASLIHANCTVVIIYLSCLGQWKILWSGTFDSNHQALFRIRVA